ncbi:MAG: PDZ domain-containing protein [Alphaproteobacteria bacterium]|nr:PDZ domain-containing protein [Alphaproteobacteria bacterium]
MQRRVAWFAVPLVAIALWWLWPGEDAALAPPAAPSSEAPAARELARAEAPDARPTAPPDPEDPSAEASTKTDKSQEQLVELQAALTADPRTHAVCELDPALPLAEAYLAVGEPGSFNGRVVQVVLGQAFLPLLEGPGEGWLTVEGYGPTPVSWTASTEAGPGRCSPEPITLQPGGTVITGTVTHEHGGAPARGAWVEGCGGFARTDADGAYYMEVVPGPCQVMAMRQDGMLRTVGEAAQLQAKQGEDQVVDLVIPGFARAGLGVGVALHEEGVSVDRVLEGTAAEEAGLEEGDIIVSLDGEPVVDMELAEFVDLAGGREGSVVQLVVLRAGEERPIELERRPVR